MYVLMLVTTVEFGHVILTRIGDVEVEMISTATHCKYISVSMFLMLTEVTNDFRSTCRAAAWFFHSPLGCVLAFNSQLRWLFCSPSGCKLLQFQPFGWTLLKIKGVALDF